MEIPWNTHCNWKHVVEIWSTNSWIASIKKRKSIYKLHGGSHQPFNIINIIQCSQVIKQPSNLKTSELANLVLGSHLFCTMGIPKSYKTTTVTTEHWQLNIDILDCPVPAKGRPYLQLPLIWRGRTRHSRPAMSGAHAQLGHGVVPIEW